MPTTIDLFEQTTRSTRYGTQSARQGSQGPIPAMSRDISVDRDLDLLTPKSISQTQKLKEYFKKLESGFETDSSQKEDDEEDEDEDLAEWIENDDNEEDLEAEVEDKDCLSFKNLQESIKQFPKYQTLFTDQEKNSVKSFLTSLQYRQLLEQCIVDYTLPHLIESLSNLQIPAPSNAAQVITLIPFWGFTEKFHHLRSSKDLDPSLLVLLFLNQCMERSQTAASQRMIDQLQDTLFALVDEELHPLVAQTLPQLMSGHSNDSSRNITTLEKLEFLIQLLIQYFESQYFPVQMSIPELVVIIRSSFTSPQKECYQGCKMPYFFLYLLLLLQRKSDAETTSSSSFLMHKLMNYLFVLLQLLPKDIYEWTSSSTNNSNSTEKERKMFFYMDFISQLQAILGILVMKANELYELQGVASSPKQITPITNHNNEEEGTVILSADKDRELFQERFGYAVEELIVHYRILLPLMAYVIRTSILFLTVFHRPDIAYVILGENLNVDWYSYYHHLTHLSTAADSTELPLPDHNTTATTTQISPPVGSSTDNKDLSQLSEMSRTRSRSRASSLYSETGSSTPMRRKFSKAEHWLEVIHPELEDEGYQFVAILSREQCQEILQERTIGCFILRPQESFSDCQQFILSFRTKGIEVVKHAVIRREENLPPIGSNYPVDPYRRKYLYRCGKLGPVDSLDGILHAISDILADPLVFTPVVPPLLSYLPHLTNNNTSSSGPRVAEKELPAPEGSSASKVIASMEFPGFDLNHQFWKYLQDLLPKLVNTVDITRMEWFQQDETSSSPIGSDSEGESRSISDHEEEEEEEGDYRSSLHHEEEDYVLPESSHSRGGGGIGSRGLFRQLFRQAMTNTTSNNTNTPNNSTSNGPDLARQWKLSILHQDYPQLLERIVTVLAIKQYYQQFLISQCGYLLDAVWKFEIESVTSSHSNHTNSGNDDEEEDPDDETSQIPLSESDRKKLLVLQSLKQQIMTVFDTTHTGAEADLLVYYYDHYMEMEAVGPIPPPLASLEGSRETSPPPPPVVAVTSSLLLGRPGAIEASKLIFARGWFSPVLQFWLESERVMSAWIIPELNQTSLQQHFSSFQLDDPFALALSTTNTTTSSTATRGNQSIKKSQETLEMILATNLSYTSYDKISLQYLNDIVDRYTSVSSATAHATLYLVDSQSPAYRQEYALMERLLYALYHHCTVKTIRFPGHRNGAGMSDYLLPDCIEVNEVMSVLSNWLTQLEEILELLQIDLPSRSEAPEEEEEEDSDSDEEVLMNEIFHSKKSEPAISLKKPTTDKAKTKIVFSKMDLSDDDDDEDEEEDDHNNDLSYSDPENDTEEKTTNPTIQKTKSKSSIPVGPTILLPTLPSSEDPIDLRTPTKEILALDPPLPDNHHESLSDINEPQRLLIQSDKNNPLVKVPAKRKVITHSNGVLGRVFRKLTKYWPQITQHFHSLNNNNSVNNNNTSNSSATDKATAKAPFVLTLSTTKLLLQIMDLLQLPQSSMASTSTQKLKKEMSQKLINWCFLQKSLIQITKPNEISLYSPSSQTFYHYIDVWEVKVLSDVSMAKEHVRLGRQSYTGVSSNLLAKASIPSINTTTSSTAASSMLMSRSRDGSPTINHDIIAGDTELNELSDLILKKEFQFPYTTTVASLLKLQGLLEEEGLLLTRSQPPGKTATTKPGRRGRHQHRDYMNRKMKLERLQYFHYYFCKLWELVRAEPYIMDTICRATLWKDPQSYTFIPPPSNAVTYFPSDSSFASSATLANLANPTTAKLLGGNAPLRPRNMQPPNLLKSSLGHIHHQPNCYATHSHNHKQYWNGSPEGNRPYLLTLQQYLYKNALFQRLHFNYRFVAYLQIDFYGLKEILSVSSNRTATPTSSVLTDPHHQQQSMTNTVNALNQFTKTVSNQSFMSSFFGGPSLINPIATTTTPIPNNSNTSNTSHNTSHNTTTTAANTTVPRVGSPVPHKVTNPPPIVGSGSQVHSTSIISMTPTASPHSQSLEVYAVIRLVKEHYLRVDQPSNSSSTSTHPNHSNHTPTSSGGNAVSNFFSSVTSNLTAHTSTTATPRSGYYDESYVSTPKKIEMLPQGLFPPSQNSSQSISSIPLMTTTVGKVVISQIQASHDYEWRQQCIFRFPLPESWIFLIEDYLKAHTDHSSSSSNSHSEGEMKCLQTIPPMKIVISIFEKTFFTDNKLGELEMNLWDLDDQNVSKDWFPLINPDPHHKQLSSSYLLYLQTKLRFHLMQMDGNYTAPTTNTSTATAVAMASSANISSNNNSSSHNKIVGRGQPHPSHLLTHIMKKKGEREGEMTGDSQHSRASGSSTRDNNSNSNNGKAIETTLSIKITAPTVKNTLNLYDDDEVDQPSKEDSATSQSNDQKGVKKEEAVKTTPEKKGSESKTPDTVKNKMHTILKSGNNFLGHLDDFF